MNNYCHLYDLFDIKYIKRMSKSVKARGTAPLKNRQGVKNKIYYYSKLKFNTGTKVLYK